ncbi:MAG TPA: ABATE domain-containing protein [Ktedonobacteraceae bacterium]|nr:ABATE domain-containing protein [Ktedonobacteraceae bacterium]
MREIVFDFSGNCLCLNFANTLEDRASDAPRELLTSYDDLIEWAEQAQIVTSEQARELLAEAESHKGKAEKILQRARDWREVLYRIFLMLASGERPQEADLRLLNVALAQAMVHARIIPAGDGFAWRWDVEPRALDWPLWPVIRSAADILTSEEVQAVRVCAADDCNWLFLDTSKNRSRRWCDMKTCGNRAKARKHHERAKRP